MEKWWQDEKTSVGLLATMPEPKSFNFCPSKLGQNFCVRFLEEWKTPQFPFEINWPLVKSVKIFVVDIFKKDNFFKFLVSKACVSNYVINEIKTTKIEMLFIWTIGKGKILYIYCHGIFNFRTSKAQKIEVKARQSSFAICSCCTYFSVFSVTYSVKKIKQVY